MLAACLEMQSSWSEQTGLNGCPLPMDTGAQATEAQARVWEQVFETEPWGHNLNQEHCLIGEAWNPQRVSGSDGQKG